jgi:hypothetical protein
VLTEGSDWPEKQRRGVDGDGGRRRWGSARGEGCCRGSPGSWAPRIDMEWCCEGSTGVKEDGNTPAEMNRGGGATHRWQHLVQFQPLHGPGSQVKSLGSSLAPRQSDCGGWPSLGCGGAAGPRWSRTCCAAEQGRDGARVWGGGHGVVDKEAGGLAGAFKEEGRDLEGARSGKAGEDHGGVARPVLRGGRKEGRRERRQVGSGGQ